MNPYNFSMMVFASATFFLGLLVFLKRQDDIGKAFFIFNIFVSVWSVFHAIEISQNITRDTALLCGRLGQASAVFVAPTWYHLTLIISGKEKENRKWLVLSYLVAIAIDSFAFSPWFIPRVEPTIEFNYYHRRGPVYDLFTILFFILIPAGFYLLVKKIKNSTKEEAVQLAGFTIAGGIGFIGGSFAFFPIYDILIPQYNLLILPIYPFVTSYFMIRHRLFDVEQIAQSFQREKLATIGLLTASVNHEIKNPLYAAREQLNLYIENLKHGVEGKDPLQISEKIKNQIDRALEVISKLNRFAKPTIDETFIDRKASISEALQTVLDLVAYEFSLDKIKINNQIPNDLPQIQADQRQLEEILFNLIVNACYAMAGKGDGQEGGGTLTISVDRHCEESERDPSPSLRAPKGRSNLRARDRLRNLHPRLLRHRFSVPPRNDGFIRITISDTGSGISPNQMKHLFEPFHTTKGDKGTGLGLYITKQLVERNGGKITVKSKEGQGTSFILEFRASSNDE